MPPIPPSPTTKTASHLLPVVRHASHGRVRLSRPRALPCDDPRDRGVPSVGAGFGPFLVTRHVQIERRVQEFVGREPVAVAAGAAGDRISRPEVVFDEQRSTLGQRLLDVRKPVDRPIETDRHEVVRRRRELVARDIGLETVEATVGVPIGRPFARDFEPRPRVVEPIPPVGGEDGAPAAASSARPPGGRRRTAAASPTAPGPVGTVRVRTARPSRSCRRQARLPVQIRRSRGTVARESPSSQGAQRG